MPSIPRVSDGKKVSYRDNLNIDQFFGSPGTLKSNGFPASDVTLLERMQREGGSAFEALKSHISPVSGSSSDKREPKEIMDTQKPAWVQTPAELVRHQESLFQRSERQKALEVEKKIDEPASEPASEHASAPVSE